MMKRLSLAILCCFLLSGCIFDPVFDTSNWNAYQRSSAAIRARLGNDDLRRLDIALKYLVVESMPGNAFEGPYGDANMRGALANPYVILGQLGPRINGRSAAAVIQDLALKLDAEIELTETGMQDVGGLLGSVEVISPSYYWRRSGYLAQPVIEFAVRNNGKSPISRIYFSSVLISPNRSIPWASQQFVQTFKGGLEPREKQQLTIQPRSGEWNDPQLKDLSNAQLKVAVTNFEDASGERMIAIDNKGLDVKRKVRAALR